MIELLKQIISRSDRLETVAVCTLVRTRGSSPQKRGAILVVLKDGKTLGTIGGGCVEAEVRTRALTLMQTGGGLLMSFQLNHDHGWDDGLVCGGIMDVAVQVITNPADCASFRRCYEALVAGRAADLQISVQDEAEQRVEFLLPIEPSPTLVIAGAGHVGAALAAVARQMDFTVTVIDDRPDFASAERFPDAVRHIGPVETELSKLKIDDQTYVVIVTRGHRRDALALASVVKSQARYVGLIGSRRKIITIFSELREQGISNAQLQRVHAPVGLDIGAVTPAEIAVSIAAELIAIRRGVTGDNIPLMRLTPQQVNRISE